MKFLHNDLTGLNTDKKVLMMLLTVLLAFTVLVTGTISANAFEGSGDIKPLAYNERVKDRDFERHDLVKMRYQNWTTWKDLYFKTSYSVKRKWERSEQEPTYTLDVFKYHYTVW